MAPPQPWIAEGGKRGGCLPGDATAAGTHPDSWIAKKKTETKESFKLRDGDCTGMQGAAQEEPTAVWAAVVLRGRPSWGRAGGVLAP